MNNTSHSIAKIIHPAQAGRKRVTMACKDSSICTKVALALAFLLLLQPVLGQQNFNDLNDILHQRQQLLGKDFVLMIWSKATPSETKNDTLVYKREVGEFNSKTQAPIASCSKWLTAALVMSFVDEGKIA